VQESWRSKAAGAAAMVEALLAQHGACPHRL
jgi:hypothetical protein